MIINVYTVEQQRCVKNAIKWHYSLLMAVRSQVVVKMLRQSCLMYYISFLPLTQLMYVFIAVYHFGIVQIMYSNKKL